MRIFERARRFAIAPSIIAVLVIGHATPLYAAVSNNYAIPSDVNGAGGGDEARSNNYRLIDTIGEPNIGPSGTNNYNLRAGYRQGAGGGSASLSLSGPATIDMGTIVGSGLRNTNGTWTVITDAQAGYSLSWQASTAAMISTSDTLDPFIPGTANTPDDWGLAPSAAAWGARLSSTSTDTASEWGTDGPASKWLNVATSSRTIVTRNSRTAVSGSTEVVNFRTEIGSNKIQPTGSYNVTITMTAVTLS